VVPVRGVRRVHHRGDGLRALFQPAAPAVIGFESPGLLLPHVAQTGDGSIANIPELTGIIRQ
jgi:hypothetical protein